MVYAKHNPTATYGEVRSELEPVNHLGYDHPVHGRINADEVHGITVQMMAVGTVPTSVILMTYEPGVGGPGTGMFNQMDAKAARAVAASLIRMATLVELGEKPG